MKKILLIEDNELSRKLIVKFIELYNYQPITAESAEEALEILKDETPNLILTDIMLPGMDGVTLVKKLKSDPSYSKMPIIAMSAYFMEQDKKEAFDAGCVDYIVKPIDFAEFGEKLKKYLE